MPFDELTIITKLQKQLKEQYQQIGDAMIAGGIDNMEKYKYMMGQAHAYLKISQDISNLLNKKEQQDEKGTGKKPKGSGRRLYTDENPKDTVGIKFATPADARKTVAKVKKISKPFARKIQILTVGEQRAKVMGKSKVAAIFKKGKDAIRRTNNNK